MFSYFKNFMMELENIKSLVPEMKLLGSYRLEYRHELGSPEGSICLVMPVSFNESWGLVLEEEDFNQTPEGLARSAYDFIQQNLEECSSPLTA